MPTGRVKFYDSERGFGFLATDSGEEVFLHASALPEGTDVKKGARVEFGVADGRKGKQALSVRVLDAVPTVTAGTRKQPEEMTVIVEDLIRMLDEKLSRELRRGRYPDAGQSHKMATVLRFVADQLDS